MELVIRETYAVVSALGTPLPWSGVEEYINFFYSKLIPPTYSHRASMLQDLENSKPTEVEALTGYVGDQGKKLSIATPTCDCFTAMIRFQEHQSDTGKRQRE